MIVIDVECYKNYFLLAALHVQSGKVKHFELTEDTNTLKGLSQMMNAKTTVSFNGNGYDLPMIAAALKGYDNAKLKRLSDKIIKSNLPTWRVCKDIGLRVPNWDHIDLIDVAPGTASLKIYGARLKAPKLQDLPIEPDALISEEQRDLMRRYCVNDLDTTALLLKTLTAQIELRKKMGEEYGLDLRSKSDAQIAETVIVSELEALTGQSYRAPKLPDDYRCQYQNPEIIEFKDDALNAMFKRLLGTKFELAGNGSIKLPDWLKKEPVMIGGVKYQMGVGGLHSCEKSQCVKADANYLLFELDVASYYPSIILQQRLAPDSLGEPFLKVYQSIVTRRIAAKRSGDKVASDTLKIAVNGSFGKLGSKWSKLYAPDLLIQTTLTGQLALLMLIERMNDIGVRVVSANTDGVVLHLHKDLERKMEAVAFDWMLDTSYELERTDYSVIASRDVNNYVAVKSDGRIKCKGVLAPPGLMKNPDFPIVSEAVADTIAKGRGVDWAETYIRNCQDITKFCHARRVQGGAVWRGEALGRAVRFYYSTEVAEDEAIHYVLNGNRVNKSAGAKPVMDLPEDFPTDVDYKAYIVAAEKLLCEVGYVGA